MPAETFPNSQHGVQQFCLRREGGKLLLYICNKKSDKDNGRNIPDTDFIDTDFIDISKTDVRDQRGELTTSSVLRSRMTGEACGEITLKKLRQFFENENRHRVRLEIKVFEGSVLVGSATSPGILDKMDKKVGALNVSDLIPPAPLYSCDKGGAKVIMVSAYKNWHKSVTPIFSLKDRNGSWIAEDSHENRLLVQLKKEDVSNDGKSLSFLTPAQPHLKDWEKEGMQLYLRVLREDGAISGNSFLFQYNSHDMPVSHHMCLHSDSQEERQMSTNGKPKREQACQPTQRPRGREG